MATNPMLPNDDVYRDGITISTIMQRFLVPQLPFLEIIPWVESSVPYIQATQESYSADDDPLNETVSSATTDFGGWPEVNVTLGSPVTLNTKMRKTKCTFTKEDLSDPNFASIVTKTYGRMAWLIAKQINSNIASTVQTATTGYAAQTTNFDKYHVGAWEDASDPLLDIRSIAQDISAKIGYTLDTVVVHTNNYFELLNYLMESDQDRDYARTQFPPELGFYNQRTYLTNPGCWVIGVPNGVGITEGDIVGLGRFQGMPCVETFVYVDQQFSYNKLPIGEDVGKFLNLPLNVNPWDSPDNRTYNVEAWINSACHVGNPYGVFYKSGGC